MSDRSILLLIAVTAALGAILVARARNDVGFSTVRFGWRGGLHVR